MSGHTTAQSLSLYLDAALAPAERLRVEDHLESCPACRQRLDGLRRVVSGLGRLPTAVPPEDLAARVGREIDLRGRGGPWWQVLETRQPRPLLASPPIHILALVLALGAIVYLFAFALERSGERPTRIVPLSAEEVVVERPAAGGEAAPTAGDAGDSLYLLGGRFRWAEGVWVEEGLARRRPDARVAIDASALAASPELAELAESPEVAQLAALDAPLRLRVAGEVVEIAFEAAPAGE